MFDILLTHPKSVSGPWLRPPGKRPVADLYSLSDTLPILSYTVTVFSGSTSRPVLVKYQDTTFQQALLTNRPVINITDLTFTLPVKIKSLPVSSTIESVSSQQDKPGTHHDKP